MCKNAISCTYAKKICKILHFAPYIQGEMKRQGLWNCTFLICTFAILQYLAHFTHARSYSFIYHSSSPLCPRCKVQDFAQLYNLKVRDFAHLLMRKVQDVAHQRCSSLHFCTLKNATFQNVTCSHYMKDHQNKVESLCCHIDGNITRPIAKFNPSLTLSQLGILMKPVIY